MTVQRLLIALGLFLVELGGWRCAATVEPRCLLYTFVPFTDDDLVWIQPILLQDGSYNVKSKPTTGFYHMSAAMLAMDHFNARNGTVVPQLNSNITENCSFYFDTNNSRVFDTGSSDHKAIRSLLAAEELPCAIAGPYNDIPALELSTMASAGQYPMVAYRAFNLRVTSEIFSPYTSLVYPDLHISARRLISFLVYKGRTNYISILYALSDAGMQQREALITNLENRGMEWHDAPYISMSSAYGLNNYANGTYEALAGVKKRGFRTIIICTQHELRELPIIANAAEDLGMLDGDYFWVWFGDNKAFSLSVNNTNITKILRGSAWLTAIEQSSLRDSYESDPLYVALTSQGSDFVDRVNAANPMQPGEIGYYHAEPDFFQNLTGLEFGMGFIYDSVMSIGLGGCIAEHMNRSGMDYAYERIKNLDFLEGIRHVNFDGASGEVRFQGNVNFKSGSRATDTATWAILNLLPVEDRRILISETYRVSDIHLPENGTWTEIEPFIFASGSTSPPEYLRDPPNQNFLSVAVRGLGFALLGTVAMTGLCSCVWIFVNRNHPVLLAAQPHFLYMVCFGAVMSACAIIPISFDESLGWSVEMLSKACMATPWVFCLGLMIVYCALFSKLWRAHRVMQFTRKVILVRHVIWPSISLLIAALIVLALWSILDPLTWTRVVLNGMTGESIGFCNSDNMIAFAMPLAIISAVPVILTGFMAWKTRDVNEAFTEGFWILALMLLHVEMIILSLPVIFLLRVGSTHGRHVGVVIIFWVFPMSSIGLILFPKWLAHYHAIKGTPQSAIKRGTNVGVRISGLDVELPSSVKARVSSDGGISSGHGTRTSTESDGGLYNGGNPGCVQSQERSNQSMP